MNQPQNPVPPRGARPQLFNAPASTTANAKRHADFGPSILATIDGGQARFARPRDRMPRKGLLIAGALALMLAAGYLGVKFNGSHAAPAHEVVVTAPVLKAVEASPPASQAVVAPGAAAIETVTPVIAVVSASAASQPSAVAASLNNIQQALDRSEPVQAKKEPAAIKDSQPARRSPQPAVSAAKPSTKPALDDDADLLAAMLPHLKRSPVAPTSPAHDKRCGQLTGDAASECRAKFCSGKQGADAACPAMVKPAQK